MTKTFSTLTLAILFLFTDDLSAQTVRPPPPVRSLAVWTTGGFMAAIQAIAPDYEKATGVKLIVEESPSTGNAATQITNRLGRGETADVVITEDWALQKLVEQGQVQRQSRVDLGKSFIAMAVRKGAKIPDIHNMEDFAQTLQDAESIALSDNPSGVYLLRVLFPQMHLSERLKDKIHMMSAESVAQAVANGEAQIGFQQLSELKQEEGIDVVGLIPDQVQKMTLYSAAVTRREAHQEDAAALLAYLDSSAASAIIESSGLTPVH
ncbi:MAG: transporter substrate-binding protein [Pseudomonas sp.]|jgi:molybdenum ABC transporter molybdate-binding protein|nr:transporter substrate-binding protein [Pseudomonas sp.]